MARGKRMMLRLMCKLLRSKFRMHLLRARNEKLIQTMNLASLSFVDELRQASKSPKQLITSCTQTDHGHVPLALLPDQETIARQRDLIDVLAEEVRVSNQRRFVAEEMLHRKNYPKVDTVLRALGR